MEILSDTVKNNNKRLETFTSYCAGKRIKRELDNMYKIYDDIIVEFIQGKTIEEDFLNIYVYETINNKRICYKFNVGINYPFRCPTINLNKHKYKQLLCTKTMYETINLKKHFDKDCLCCTSITCSVNWSPGNTLCDLINEIKYFKNIKKSLVFKIFIKYIKLKYLIEDIDIDSFLF